MRIGIFGGSFDPPHLGHVLAAVDAAESLALDQLFWVPASQQPLKSGESSDSLTSPSEDAHVASADDRYAMVEAAVSGYPKFVPSRIELERKGLSYTVATVEAFAQAYPNAERFLLMGDDAWNQFERWYQPERIRTSVQVAVLARSSDESEGASQNSLGHATREPDYRLRTRLIDISSTEVKTRVRAGKPIRGFVSDAVAAIIESKGLYRW